MKSSRKKLSSLPLMLLFTAAGFIVLVASVILMTVESLISSLTPKVSSAKAGNWKENFVGAESQSIEQQVCSRT